MSLPSRQQRALDQIELILQAHDPGLTSLFATFARLTSQEAMPKIEELSGRLTRLLRPVALIPIMVLVVVGSVVLGSFMPGPRCGTTPVTRAAAHIGGRTGGCSPGMWARSWSLGGH